MEPWWKRKTSYVVIVAATCAIFMLVAASINLKAANRLGAQEDSLLDRLEKAINNLNPVPVTTLQPSSSTENPRPTTAEPSSSTVGPPQPVCVKTENKDKFDCLPDIQDEEDNEQNKDNENRCNARGCCWEKMPQIKPNYENPAPVNIPQCFFPPGYQGYTMESIREDIDQTQVILTRRFSSGLRHDIKRVRVTLVNYDYTTARIVIDDPSRARWEPPIPPVAIKSTYEPVGYNITFNDYNTTIVIKRRGAHSSDAPIFQAKLSTLFFSDQFLQFTMKLPSHKVYGLSDMKGGLLHSTNWTRRIMFNKDQCPRVNRALYGAHTFMLNMNEGGRASGLYIKNSNAMDVVFQPTPAATFRALGGIFDMFVFTGPSPSNVVSQYQNLIGLPKMVPYWSLGYHLCRYGYWSLDKTEETYDRNLAAGVPLEVMWNDIDYMDKFNMFTYSKVNFTELPAFIKKIHDTNRHYVMIFDPAVSGSEEDGTYPPYDRGMQLDVFLKDVNGKVVPYKVWNTKTSIFPDFTHPSIQKYWNEMFKAFHDKIDFDGAWIDMNEPSNQKNGTLHGCPNTTLDFPDIVIGGEPLFTYTACMSDRFHWSSHYDVHNLYPHLEARATYRALVESRQKRPFIISRSSSPGQGFWSGHWTGDIDSTWVDMKQTIPDIINFGMFGMPMLGADICGFQYNTTVELCARWQALGAFYPFSRNHNDIERMEQDPASPDFGGGSREDNIVLNSTIVTLEKKYFFAPYLYTLFYRANTLGETVFRALFMNFPEDEKTHAIDEQFMWGDGLMILPALEENVNKTESYLPAGVWYHYNANGKKYENATGVNVTFDAPWDDINVLIRGGVIIPCQQYLGTNDSLMSTKSKSPMTLTVALDNATSASGELFSDDGDSLETVETGAYNLISFEASQGSIITSVRHWGYEQNLTVSTIHVYGQPSLPKSMMVNGKSHSEEYIKYDSGTQLLQLLSVNLDLKQQNSITFH